MFYLSDETATKLHTDSNGCIWYAVGITSPENSNQILDTFLLSHHIGRLNTCVRILGVRQNAELIVNLYARKLRRELANICVAGPNVCESAQELADPVAALIRMRDVYAATSCGGWHEMTESEYVIYSLIAKQNRTVDWYDKTARTLYAAHPLYKVLDFIGGVSHKDAAELLTTIVDPRWYVDRRRPDNPNKLELFLGLTPKTQKRVSDTTKIIHRGRDMRCAIAQRCWKTQDPVKVDFAAPENFLWRVWKAAGEGVKGDLRASQALIRYLRANWIDILSSRKGAADKFFIPDRFFKSAKEVTAFQKHVAV